MRAFDFYEHEINRRMRLCLYMAKMMACMAAVAVLASFIFLVQNSDDLSALFGVLEHQVSILSQQNDSLQVRIDAICE